MKADTIVESDYAGVNIREERETREIEWQIPQQTLRLLNLNAFKKKSLFELVNGVYSKPPNTNQWQLILKGI